LEGKEHLQNLKAKLGPWVGRAILWGVQTYLHRDGLDGKAGVCTTFNSGEYQPQYEDGYGVSMVILELKMAFRCSLYH
jgi:hypothetical protein